MHDQPNPGPRKDTRGSRKRVAPGVFERAGKYLIAYVDGTGKEHVETLGAIRKPGQRTGITLRDAIAAREAKRVRLRSGEDVAPTRMTVAEAWADYSEALDARVASGELAKRTAKLYKQRWTTHLEPSLGRLQIQAVRASHVTRLLGELRSAGISSWTVQGIYVVLSALFAHSVTRGWVAQSPTARLSKSERPKPRNAKKVRMLTPEEIAKVQASATKRWKPLIMTLALTGMRVSEALGLVWADIDLKVGTIRIEKQLGRDGTRVRCKTERSVRTLTMSAELKRTLREHQLASGRRNGFLFASKGGAAPSYHNARRELTRALEKAGIAWDTETERVSYHALRHGAVSAMIRAGVDPVRIASFIGDRVETVLSVYSHEWEAGREGNVADVLAAAYGV